MNLKPNQVKFIFLTLICFLKMTADRICADVVEVNASNRKAILFVIRKDDLYGFADSTGKVVIVPRFQAAGTFSDGDAPVMIGKKWGYVDASGHEMIPPSFESAGPFSQGRALVQVTGRFGYISLAGEQVIPTRFDRAKDFSEELAAVRIDNRWGFIDRNGMQVIAPRYESAGDFSEGLAPVKLEGKWIYIDKKGETVLLLHGNYSDAKRFSGGLAAVRLETTDKGSVGYIDRAGKFVIRPNYDWGGTFSEGVAAVLIDQRWGYIDKSGTVVIPPIFYKASSFSNLRAEVIDGFGRSRYIDLDGKLAFDKSNVVETGMAGVEWTKVKCESTPAGAEVYMVPLYVWEHPMGILDNPDKLGLLKVPEGSTSVETRVYARVYVILFELRGMR